MFIGSDDEHELEYIQPGTLTPTHASRNTIYTPKKRAPMESLPPTLKRSVYLPPHLMGRLHILKDRLAPRKRSTLRILMGLRRFSDSPNANAPVISDQSTFV